MQRRKAPSHSQRLYKELKRAVVTCVLLPGEMVSEKELAAQYEVSKTPVREALGRLAQEGFVRPIAGAGYLISPVTVADAHEVFEMRLILEKATAKLAAERITNDQLERLYPLAEVAYAYKNHTTYAIFLEANRAFHLSVAEATGNGRLVEALRANLIEMERLLHLSLDLRDSAEEMRHEHRDLVQTLRDHDSARAAQTAIGQVVASRDRVIDALASPSWQRKPRFT